jgi:hypothetical protein
MRWSLSPIQIRNTQMADLLYFRLLSVERCADALHVHPNTPIRDLDLARKRLKRELVNAGESVNAA